MVKPQQKVIVYRQGIVTDSRKRDKQNQIDKSKQGMPACQRCGAMPALSASDATPSTSTSTSSSGTAQHISAWPRARIVGVSAASWYGPSSTRPCSTVQTHSPQPPARQS